MRGLQWSNAARLLDRRRPAHEETQASSAYAAGLRLGWRSLKGIRHVSGFLLRHSEHPAGFAALFGAGIVAILLYGMVSTPGETAPTQGSETTSAPESEDIPADAPQSAATAPQSSNTPAAMMANGTASGAGETFTLKSGETLIRLLARAKIANGDAHGAIAALRDIVDLRRLRPGQDVRVWRTVADSRLNELRLRDKFDAEAVVRRSGDGFAGERATIASLPVTRYIEGTINDSLYLSATKAGLPEPVLAEMIRLMSYSVDFQRDIRVGDHFEIYFERQYAPDFGDVAEGRILWASLDLGKRRLEATHFVDHDGMAGYYDENGTSIRKALMRTPVDGARLSSRFGKRRHPILGYTRMHKGLDFAAPRGTPIMAAGDGVVETAGRNGGYGNYIRLRHNSELKTAYAHLTRFAKGIRRGKQVRQGEIIGFVGSTGRSTGPHLHYEVLKGSRQVNPLTLKLPPGRTLRDASLDLYRQGRHRIIADIATIKGRDTLTAETEQTVIALAGR